MTSIPLSMRESYGQTLSGTEEPSVTARADDDGKLDALVDSVAERIAHRDASDDRQGDILLDEPTDDDSWRELKAKLDDADAAEERGPESELDRALKSAVDLRA